jgi:hypothetical protein
VLTWTTKAVGDREWQVTVTAANDFTGDLMVHVHPPNGETVTPRTVKGDALQAGKAVSLTIRT